MGNNISFYEGTSPTEQPRFCYQLLKPDNQRLRLSSPCVSRRMRVIKDKDLETVWEMIIVTKPIVILHNEKINRKAYIRGCISTLLEV